METQCLNKRYQYSHAYMLIIASGLCLSDSKADEVDYQISSIYQSRYITEGRNNLSKGGAVFYSAEATAGLWNLSAVNVRGSSDHYEETGLSLSYSFEFEHWTVTPGYTWLNFSNEVSSNDQEVGISFEYNNNSPLYHQLDWYYAKDASGSFYTWQTGLKHEVLSGVSFEPYLQVGANKGYVSGEHYGLNHYQLGIKSSVQIKPSLALYLSLNTSKPINKKANETLEDLNWFSIGFNFPFH
jgi:hypothetical protein